MKKIMFNDRFGMTDAVIEGRKTMTRRLINPPKHLGDTHELECRLGNSEDSDKLRVYWFGGVVNTDWTNAVILGSTPIPYQVGEEVAIAISYKNLNERGFVAPEWCDHTCESSQGYNNKMFVSADLMPYRIKITKVSVERLQSISDEDCIKEGVTKNKFRDFPQEMFFPYVGCKDTEVMWYARAAFSILIDRVSGRGTFGQNPWVLVYEFELCD